MRDESYSEMLVPASDLVNGTTCAQPWVTTTGLTSKGRCWCASWLGDLMTGARDER
jgi:hypothetical protein